MLVIRHLVIRYIKITFILFSTDYEDAILSDLASEIFCQASEIEQIEVSSAQVSSRSDT